LKRIDVGEMVDVCGGMMSIKSSLREIERYMLKKPSHLVVEYFKTEDGHRVIIWMTKPDFLKTC
jgi:hypothetical protein